jgi:hypothetical protein
MAQSKDINEEKQLLVEGRDDEVFFQALICSLGLTGIQVRTFDGIDVLPRFLRAFVRVPGFGSTVRTLGVVRDADANPKGAFQSVCTALHHADLPRPRRAGTPVGDHPTVSVLILPDATTPGMLETLCARAVSSDLASRCVDGFLDCVKGCGNPIPGNLDKAWVHAFLASRPKPDLQVGRAAAAGYWPWDHPEFDHVKEFLRSL